MPSEYAGGTRPEFEPHVADPTGTQREDPYVWRARHAIQIEDELLGVVDEVGLPPPATPAAGTVLKRLNDLEAGGGGGSGPSPATTVQSETSFGLSSQIGTSLLYARGDHRHGTPANPGGGGGAAYTGSQWEVWVDDMAGADDNAKVAAAYAAIVAARRTQGGADLQGSAVLRFGARNYTLTADAVMMAQAAFTGMSWGIKFLGMGKYLTKIIYTPTAEAYLLRNTDDWGGIIFEGIEFSGGNANACFYRGDRQANGYAQQHSFISCSWSGTWKYGFRISGIDNNDTFSWFDCSISGTWNTWFWSDVDAVSVNDQQVFFNYYHTTMHFTSCTYVFRYTRGGFINLYGASLIALSNTVWFKLEGYSHDGGSMELLVSGARMELHASTVKVIESEWGYGHISFVDVDTAAVAALVGIWETASFEPTGATITWERCKIQGQHSYKYDFAGNRSPNVWYNGCEFWDHSDPSNFILTPTVGAGGNLGNIPVIHFRRCRGTGNYYDESWNTDWNWQLNLRGQTQRQVVSFKDTFGTNPSQAGLGIQTAITRVIPLHARIVNAEIHWESAIGTAGGHMKFQTGEGTPTVILDATGLDVAGGVVTPPGYRLRCDTTAKRTITLTTDAGVTGYITGAGFEAWIEYIG